MQGGKLGLRGRRLTPLCAVLPRPSNRSGICEPLVQVTVTSHVQLARALGFQVIIRVFGKDRVARPSINRPFRALALGPALRGSCSVRLGVLLEVVAELTETQRSTFHTVRLP